MNAGLDHWRIEGFFQLSSILAKCKRNSYGSGKSNVFAIQKFEVRETIIASEIFEQRRQSFLENLELYGNMISNTLRFAFGELLEGHIGVELANTYFWH